MTSKPEKPETPAGGQKGTSKAGKPFAAHTSPQIDEGEAGAHPDKQIAQKSQQASGQGSGKS